MSVGTTHILSFAWNKYVLWHRIIDYQSVFWSYHFSKEHSLCLSSFKKYLFRLLIHCGCVRAARPHHDVSRANTGLAHIFRAKSGRAQAFRASRDRAHLFRARRALTHGCRGVVVVAVVVVGPGARPWPLVWSVGSALFCSAFGFFGSASGGRCDFMCALRLFTLLNTLKEQESPFSTWWQSFNLHH